MKEITKEKLLDVRNVKLLRELKEVFDNKLELEGLHGYLYEARKTINLCRIEESEAGNDFNARRYSTKLLIDIIEMIKKGHLVLKDGDNLIINN